MHPHPVVSDANNNFNIIKANQNPETHQLLPENVQQNLGQHKMEGEFTFFLLK